jgi:hypothetical protein
LVSLPAAVVAVEQAAVVEQLAEVVVMNHRL